MASRWKVNITPAERTARGVIGAPPRPRAGIAEGEGAHAGHRWMMLICCVPMIAIVLLLIVSGTAGSSALLWALGCVAMMAAMMFMMPGGHSHK
ncbi:hypothetical protein [Nocardioides sp.]|uniref:hypothetical protein n=1 Tax=Nocardioides sp. TaxID=35761 RepID=UPI00286DF914|nr:hypothetical protein [Nocardioides sp.]